MAQLTSLNNITIIEFEDEELADAARKIEDESQEYAKCPVCGRALIANECVINYCHLKKAKN
ncbi:MAG: hypothetical protein HQK79_19930 [Desulfobacterales bacterium]|nr:hypothetical protein [Desulfobacterales bacterium]